MKLGRIRAARCRALVKLRLVPRSPRGPAPPCSSPAAAAAARGGVAPIRPRWRRPRRRSSSTLTVRPEGETKTNIEALAKKIAGIDDLGDLIVDRTRRTPPPTTAKSSTSKRKSSPGSAKRPASSCRNTTERTSKATAPRSQTTDEERSRRIRRQADRSRATKRSTDGSYEGVDFKVQEDENARSASSTACSSSPKTKRSSSRWSTPPNGENLGRRRRLHRRHRRRPRRQRRRRLRRHRRPDRRSGRRDRRRNRSSSSTPLGIEPDEATARRQPRSRLRTRSRSTSAPTSAARTRPRGDASELLGSLPGTARSPPSPRPNSASASTKAIDQIDEDGIPGEVPPNQLKKTLKEAGIDLESIPGSIGDVGVFVTATAKQPRRRPGARNRRRDRSEEHRLQHRPLPALQPAPPASPRSTAKRSGFSIRSPNSAASRSSSPPRAAASRSATASPRRCSAFEESGKTLADSAAYKEAASALGSTPIAVFVDGPSALKLANALVPAGDEGFEEAKPYLQKIDYLALGSEASGDLATAKLIVGVGSKRLRGQSSLGRRGRVSPYLPRVFRHIAFWLPRKAFGASIRTPVVRGIPVPSATELRQTPHRETARKRRYMRTLSRFR